MSLAPQIQLRLAVSNNLLSPKHEYPILYNVNTMYKYTYSD